MKGRRGEENQGNKEAKKQTDRQAEKARRFSFLEIKTQRSPCGNPLEDPSG